MKLTELFESKSAPSFPDIEKLKSIMRSERHVDRVLSLKEKIELALAKGEVLNTVYKEYKDKINSLIDNIMESIGEKYYHGGAYKNLPEDYQHLKYWGGAVNLKSLSKKMVKLSDKSLPIYKDLEKLVNILMPYVEISDYLKDKVVMFKDVKAKEKSERVEKETEMHKQLVSHKDVKKVVELLKDTASDVKKKLFDANLKWFMSFVDMFENRKEGTSYKDMKSPIAVNILSKIVERKGVYYKDMKEELKPNYKETLKAEAQKMTDEIIDGFVYKNTHKIAFILTKKNNLKNVSISNVRFNAGVIECDVKCTFNDGSEFRVHNQVVMSSSKYGNWFYRYPTTFHNVKLSDGSKMTSPSELKMEKNFI